MRASNYLEVNRDSNVPDGIISIATGSLSLARMGRPSWQGFPPALLPFAETDSGIMYGYWRHWFTETRKPTIVQFYGRTLFSESKIAMEHARNATQFIYIYLLEEISDEGITLDSVRIASAFSIADLDRIQEISDVHSDHTEGLLDHPAFCSDPPHSCFVDDSAYPGEFPHPGIERDPEQLRYACGYEIHSRFGQGIPDPLRYREFISTLPFAPPWLRGKSQFEIFTQLIDQSDLLGAWMSLNSLGWQFKEARVAMSRLAEKANDPQFSRLAKAWCSLSHESRMRDGY